MPICKAKRIWAELSLRRCRLPLPLAANRFAAKAKGESIHIHPLSNLYAHIGKSITLPQQTKQTPAPHPSHSVQLGRYLFDCFTRAFGACRGLLRLNR